jgi:hypothetical protein
MVVVEEKVVTTATPMEMETMGTPATIVVMPAIEHKQQQIQDARMLEIVI